MPGWFGFETRGDLLSKLERDLARLRQDPADGDAAFNLFVTAWSLVDWLHPGNPAAREALRTQHHILQACAHLADGSKHLLLHNPGHVSVHNTTRGGNWAQWPLRMSPGQRPVSPKALFVHLTGAPAEAFGCFPSALELAEKTVTWLRDHAASVQ